MAFKFQIFDTTGKSYKAVDPQSTLALDATTGQPKLGLVALADLTDGASHAAQHFAGDPLRSATAVQSGVMTAAYASKLDGIEASADVTDPTNVAAAGAVMEGDYGPQSILAAVADNTPTVLTVNENTIVGRITAGNVTALSAANVRTIINVENGADVTDPTNVAAAGAVMEGDYGAHSILAATVVDTPVSLTVGEQTIVGRKTGGNIAALTATEVRTILNVENGADVTDPTNVENAGAVMNIHYNAHTILRATLDNNPTALVVGEQTIIGRITAGNIAALTATQVRTLINVENGAQEVTFSRVNAALLVADAIISVNNQRITMVATPTESSDAVNKEYADNIAAGILPKAAVNAASTANIVSGVELLRDGGPNGRPSLTDKDPTFPPLSIDGVSLSVGDRVLLKDNTDFKGSSIGINSGTPADFFGDYITIYDSTNTATHFWFDTTGSDVVPIGATNPVKVDISGDATAEGIAVTLSLAIKVTAGYNSWVCSELGATYVITANRFSGNVTNTATTDVVNTTVYNRPFGGANGVSSIANGIWVVMVQGNSVDTNWQLEVAPDVDCVPKGEVRIGAQTFVSAGLVNEHVTFTQTAGAGDTAPDLLLLWDTQYWSASSAGVYSSGNGLQLIGNTFSVKDGDGITSSSGSVAINYTVTHTFSGIVDVSTPTNWKLNNIAFGGTMTEINILRAGVFSAADNLHAHDRNISVDLYNVRGGNVLEGMLMAPGKETGADGVVKADATSDTYHTVVAAAAEAILDDTAGQLYLRGTSVGVLFDKDHSGGNPGDRVCIHPSRAGYATMATDFSTGWFVVVGTLLGTLTAGDGINDSLVAINFEPSPVAPIKIS